MFFFPSQGRKLNSLDNHKINFLSECSCAYIYIYLLVDPLAALINSSAKHSAVTRRYIAWFTRRSGETSTACLLTTPAAPNRVASSLGPLC